jgi:hypothetical protein
MDHPVSVTVDISGSEGAELIGFGLTKDALTKTVMVESKTKRDLAAVKLFGDWDLNIKVTYELT